MIAWATLGTAVVLGLTALFVWSQLRDARRTRHGQLIIEISNQWTNAAASESFALYAQYNPIDLVEKVFGPRKPGDAAPSKGDAQDYIRLSYWANLIESMGLLVKVGAITEDVVYHGWGGGILTAWDQWENAVLRLREYDDEPDTYQHFQEVAEAMQQISDRRKAELERG